MHKGETRERKGGEKREIENERRRKCVHHPDPRSATHPFSHPLVGRTLEVQKTLDYTTVTT